jgi:hypothetical protein
MRSPEVLTRGFVEVHVGNEQSAVAVCITVKDATTAFRLALACVDVMNKLEVK